MISAKTTKIRTVALLLSIIMTLTGISIHAYADRITDDNVLIVDKQNENDINKKHIEDSDNDEPEEVDVQQVLKIIDAMSNDVIMTTEGLVGLPGDANGDGVVNASDALSVIRSSIGLEEIKPSYLDLADANGDDEIDNVDAMIILRKTVGMRDNVFMYDEAVQGIDVSYCQTYIDFEALRKNTDIDFVIIRAGYGCNVDPWFETNYMHAREQGFNIGVYWYSYAGSIEAARREAETCASLLEGKYFEYPIFFDIEESWQLARGPVFCSSITDTFCSTIAEKGWYPAFYTSMSFVVSYIYKEVAEKYDYWVAQWSDQCTYGGPYTIWQYGLRQVDGVNGDVDADYGYANYPRYMRFYGLNGN